MKFKVTAVQVTRVTRRRAGKSKTEVIDTETMRAYRTVGNYDFGHQPKMVEKFYEEANATNHCIVKVIDVERLSDEQPYVMDETDRNVFTRIAKQIRSTANYPYPYESMTVAQFVSVVSDRMLSSSSGLSEEYRERWMRVPQKEKTKLLAGVM